MKKYRWNKKKCFTNIAWMVATVALMAFTVTMFMYGIAKEVQYQELRYQQHQEELHNN